jgi:hypothetical protein
MIGCAVSGEPDHELTDIATHTLALNHSPIRTDSLNIT